MSFLLGGDGFAALSDALAGQRNVDDFQLADHGAERLRRAVQGQTASDLDIAVLMRHALLAEGRRRGDGSRPSLSWPRGHPAREDVWQSAGLERSSNGRIVALEWRPDWLDPTDPAIDALAAEASPRRFGADDGGPEGDPFLSSLGFERYRSVGQRAAVRAALLTPAGATTAIDLPTGEGKSLVFRVIDEIGFATEQHPASVGVTLVVTPTVALALDHENTCQRDENVPLAYVGGNEVRRAAILERLRETKSGLVFCAPEAACSSLRTTLRDLARSGHLKALVIDEAHLVDAWGTGFRPEFQSLSGLRQELLEASSPRQAVRTLLLSATLTSETLETLEALFSPERELALVSAAQARPEPSFFVAPPSSEIERTARVEEAILRLPRPTIVYVTKVADAKAWHSRLAALGFARYATFHGDTPSAERESTLLRWRRGELDLVVATSAFGLGIDYPHVRAVVHACVPETFDRFYQEVGRGGRDGRTCVSLLVPSVSDVRVARNLNRERVITIERGLQRWEAMFHHRDRKFLGGRRFRIRLDVAPGADEDDIDLVGERSLQWNARVLTLMTRARLLRLVGADPSAEQAEGVYETVEILNEAHLSLQVWEEFVVPLRVAIGRARTRNLLLMLRHLRGGECPSALVEELYGPDRMVTGCSNCSLCRHDAKRAKPSPLRREPASPWPAPPLMPPLVGLLSGGQLVVTYNPRSAGAFAERRLSQALDALWRDGARLLRMPANAPKVFERGIGGLRKAPVMTSHAASSAVSRLPAGPEVVVVGEAPGWRFPPARDGGRIVFLPDGYEDPDRPGEGLLDRYNGPALSLDTLLENLST